MDPRRGCAKLKHIPKTKININLSPRGFKNTRNYRMVAISIIQINNLSPPTPLIINGLHVKCHDLVTLYQFKHLYEYPLFHPVCQYYPSFAFTFCPLSVNERSIILPYECTSPSHLHNPRHSLLDNTPIQHLSLDLPSLCFYQLNHC